MSQFEQTLFDEIAKGYFCHAYLLEGGTASARLALAKDFARAVLCENKGADGTPCGVCNPCRKISLDNHPDVALKGLDLPETGSFGIDRIRDVRSDAYMMANESDYKIYIIASAERLSPQAQNALLKIFEEPPKRVVFLLLTPFRAALLPTVISRAKIYTLPTGTKNGLLLELKEAHPEFSTLFAERVAGFLSAIAKTTFTDKELTLCREAFELTVRFYVQSDECRLLEHLPKKREELGVYLPILALAARDVLLFKKGSPEQAFLLVGEGEVRKAAGRFTSAKLLGLYEAFFASQERLDLNGNVNAVLGELSFLSA